MKTLQEATELEFLARLGSVQRVVASNYMDDERGKPGQPDYYEGHWAVVDSDNYIWAKGRKEPMKLIAWALTNLAKLSDRNKLLEKEIEHLRRLL